MSISRKSLAMSVLFLLSLVLMLATVPCVAGQEGQGTIRIWPPLPTMLSSHATFEINCTAGTTYDPHIFLVMTDSCHEGLTGDVTVDWTGDGTADLTITSEQWHEETEHTEGIKVPPGTTNGVGYTVASLMDHLETTEPIWWAFKPFLDGAPLTQTPQTFTVDLPSTDPKMLVYALGKTDPEDALFNNRVPPSIPGFMIPELSTILLAAASFSALALYALKRRKYFP